MSGTGIGELDVGLCASAGFFFLSTTVGWVELESASIVVLGSSLLP